MTYRRANITLARYLAPIAPRDATWDEIRDWCDLATGSELTALQLDRLTDMVRERIPVPIKETCT